MARLLALLGALCISFSGAFVRTTGVALVLVGVVLASVGPRTPRLIRRVATS